MLLVSEGKALKLEIAGGRRFNPVASPLDHSATKSHEVCFVMRVTLSSNARHFESPQPCLSDNSVILWLSIEASRSSVIDGRDDELIN